MEALQLYYSLLCVVVLCVVFYFYWKRYKLFDAAVYSIVFLTLPMSHLWHLLWGEGFVYKLCDADPSEMFAWTQCIGKDFYEVFLNSYEITVFVEVAALRGLAIWLCARGLAATMNMRLRTWWTWLIVLNSICVALATLLWIVPGETLEAYAMPYNVLALCLGLFIIAIFEFRPVVKRLDEDIPLKELDLEQIDSSI